MLTPARIARLAQAQEWERLLREVLANGRPLPASAAERLARPSCVRAAAAALGLCRSLELSRGLRRSQAAGLLGPDGDSELLGALRDSARSNDPVARAFALAGLRAAAPGAGHDADIEAMRVVGETVAVAALSGAAGRSAGPLFQHTRSEEESGGALSGEGSPLDALLTVWALGGVFVSSPNTLAERSALVALFEGASRRIDSMSPRSALAADLRVMRTLAAVALRRATAMRPAA